MIGALLAILRAAGFGDQMAAWAVDRLQIYIDADVYEGALYADRFPVIASMADTMVADSDQRFEFGVELFLDGLQARLQAGR